MKVVAITAQTKILYVRRVLVGIGLVGVILYSTSVTASLPFLAVALFSAFLGITNFGRQCPLVHFVGRAIRRARL